MTVGDTCGLGVLKGVGLVGRKGVAGEVEGICVLSKPPKFKSDPGDPVEGPGPILEASVDPKKITRF